MPYSIAEVNEALKEWKVARMAFLSVDSVKQGERFPQHIWTRLANAEQRLMKLEEPT